MQPLQEDLWSRAAKDNSMTNAATVRRNLDAAITMRSAETELPNTIELRATASEIVAPKPDLDARAKKRRFWSTFYTGFLEGKSLAPKWRKSADKSLSQPSCSHSNTIYEVQLQKTIVLNACSHSMKQPWRSHYNAICRDWVAKHNRTTRNGVGNCSFKTGSRRQSEKKKILKHFLKRFLEGNSLAPKWRKKRISCETSFKTPSATHPPAPLAIPFTLRERSYSCKSQWNSVDRTCTKNTWNPIYNAEPIRPWSDHGPRMIRPWSEHDPTTHETVSQPSHRRGRSSRFGDALCPEKHMVSCSCYLSKTHFVRDFLQNSIGNSSTSTTCNPIYSEGTILELQITMEFHRQLIHPAPLATPFTLRERSYSCKSQWNSVDHKCTKHRWHPIYNAEPIREWSEHDPTHTRDRLATVAPQR